MRATFLVLALLIFSLPVRAEPAATIDEAWALYRTGHFVETETMGVDIGSPNALALAARAANVRAIYVVAVHDRRAVLEVARGHGEAALALDPWHVDGALQLVIALGQSARLMDPVDAHFEGVADTSKSVLDRLAPHASGNPYYHAVMGAWHAELVLRAGSTAARAFYGARWDLAIQHYETARELAPDAFVISTEYAKILLEQGAETNKAVGLLRNVALSVPSDAVEALVIEEAKALLATVLAGLAPR